MTSNLGYDQAYQSRAPHDQQTSICLHHSKLYQCQGSYPCLLLNQSPTTKESIKLQKITRIM